MIAAKADHIDNGVTVFSKAAGLFLLGWFACSWWYGTGSFQKVTEAIPAFQAQAGCEEWRANRNGKLALSNRFISKGQLAKDNCPHPESPVLK